MALDYGKFDNDPEPYGKEPTDEEIFASLARTGVTPDQLPDPENRRAYEDYLARTK